MFDSQSLPDASAPAATPHPLTAAGVALAEWLLAHESEIDLDLPPAHPVARLLAAVRACKHGEGMESDVPG